MGGAASSRRFTVACTPPDRVLGSGNGDPGSMDQSAARKEPSAIRINSEPLHPGNMDDSLSRHGTTVTEAGSKLRKASDSTWNTFCGAKPPLDACAQRKNTFHTLKEEVHKKRAVGKSYNEIFDELASQVNHVGERRETNKLRRRLTVHARDPSSFPPLSSSDALSASKMPHRRIQERHDGVSGDANCNHDPQSLATPSARGDYLDVAERRDYDEESEEIFPGFVERGSIGSGLQAEIKGGALEGAEITSSKALLSETIRIDPGDVVGSSDLHGSADPLYSNSNKPLRRAQIFDKGVDASMMQNLMVDDRGSDGEDPGEGLSFTCRLHSNALMGEQSADIVIGALQKFFFLEYDPEEAEGGESGGGMAMLMRAMEREEHEAGASLMEQGEEGHHMFVVEEGSLEVIIDDEAVRVIDVGDRFGELALLYNAPRSASVRTLSPCVLWSIHREVFKAVQALTASGNLIARSTHLYHVPWLRLLSTTDLSKLATCFHTVHYEDGDVILREGEETDLCFLVESGEVVCSTKHSQRVEEDDRQEQLSLQKECDAEEKGDQDRPQPNPEGTCKIVERLMMVTRPGNRQNSSSTGGQPTGEGPTSPRLPNRPGTARRSPQGIASGSSGVTSGEGGRPAMSRAPGRLNLGGVNGMGATQCECQPYWDEEKGEVLYGKGCFLGVPVLLSSTALEIDGLSGWEPSPSTVVELERQSIDPFEDGTKEQDMQDAASFSALSPVKVVARGQVKIGYFDVSRFTKSVGPFAKVLRALGKGRESPTITTVRDRKSVARKSFVANAAGGVALQYEKLTVDSFERLEFLGQGSFGFVTMVRKKEGAMEGILFALKSLSKRAVVEGGQVQHIKDEKSVLELFNHPFILRLYTTFQDNNRVYFLTELLIGGELWSIIYESASGFCSGLPPDHVKFYSAVVVDALAYMHKKGIAYRDLKPENLIVDEAGYLRVIDMGFAKQIPFFVTIGGETQMHPRSHTMCGTPEYLAPEFIFNKGHDQSADIWALGVLVFEMVEARTPFVQAGQEPDTAQLFTSIACVKKRGVDFGDSFDEKAGGQPDCRDMISRMLAFEPGDRLGNQAKGWNDVKGHSMYEGLDWDSLEEKLIQAPWVPKKQTSFPEPETPTANDVYTGNQEYFSKF